MAAVRHFFYVTAPLAKALAVMFEILFPEEYQTYQKAFAAGCWYTEDPGPWLGRVIVYKLDVSLHHDKKDGGPTATFPMGEYDGGFMEFPQLHARYQ